VGVTVGTVETAEREQGANQGEHVSCLDRAKTEVSLPLAVHCAIARVSVAEAGGC
jgi:hypothetical protein